MVGVFKLITILATPFPPVLHRPTSFIFHRFLGRRISTAKTRHISLSYALTNRHRARTVLHTSINSSFKEIHAQTFNPDSESGSSTHKPTPIHPWPEWSRFLDNLVPNHWNQSPGTSGHGLSPEDTFVVYEEKELCEEFIHHASVCLAFARSRPDLLSLLSKKDIEVIALNGTPFLFKSALDIARRMRAYLGMEGANVLEQNKVTLVDIMKYILSYACNPSISSKRDSLYSRDLVESSVRSLLYQMTVGCFGSPVQKGPASEHHQFYGGNEQSLRPVRQNVEMKRGDWICLKCSFLNFARNLKCLECEELRPKKQLTGWEWQCPQCNFYNYGSNLVCLRCDCKRPGAAVTSNVHFVSELRSINVRLPENEEKTNSWFNDASQLDNSADMRGASVDEDFPEINPLSKEENRSVVSARKTPLVVKQVNCQSLKGMGEYGTSEGDISESSGPNKAYDSSNRPSLDQILGHSSPVSRISDPTATQVNVQTDASSPSENKQAEKSEKWFQRVAELHNVKDLPSAISDEEFPEIMPMRKGENRFVVSKKKDHSLTSPAYKRHAATGQTNNSNFVPFVPFPPGYFARKDTGVSADGNSSTESPTETSRIAENLPKKDDDGGPRVTENNAVQQAESQLRSSVDWSLNSSGSLGMSLGRNTSLNSFTSHTIGSELGTSRHLRDNNASQSRNPAGGTVQLPNQNARSGWTGKSLEGSAVKEPDHLDMSEEAKAERWFRRVAQIKDISELSQIPDEDFPSIMPMRKGVNRFVVSKRKTPLERRLTSPQCRRNLPIESSHIMNKDNDNK